MVSLRSRGNVDHLSCGWGSRVRQSGWFRVGSMAPKKGSGPTLLQGFWQGLYRIEAEAPSTMTIMGFLNPNPYNIPKPSCRLSNHETQGPTAANSNNKYSPNIRVSQN